MMNMINTVPALQENDQLRADIYALLANLLRKIPDQEMLDWLASLEPEGEEDNPMTRAWAAVAMMAKRSQVENLDDEFHGLFIGMARGELVPYGSWYMTGSLMEKPLARLRDDLALLGFERQESVFEPEDHLAALCEVMSLLISENRGYGTQQEFWSQHMKPWAERFFRDLQNAKHAVFYTTVGLLGEAFMQQEDALFINLSPAALGKQAE